LLEAIIAVKGRDATWHLRRDQVLKMKNLEFILGQEVAYETFRNIKQQIL